MIVNINFKCIKVGGKITDFKGKDDFIPTHELIAGFEMFLRLERVIFCN